MEPYYGVILRDHITESYYGMRLWIIWQNHLCEKDAWGAWGVPGAPWDPEDSLGTPLGPAGTPLGPPGTHLGPLGTHLERSRTPLGPPGRPWEPRAGTSRDPLWSLADNKNNHISTDIQRQKLSIAVFEPACWDPSTEGQPRTVLSIKRPPKLKKLSPGPRISWRSVWLGPYPCGVLIYKDIYIFAGQTAQRRVRLSATNPLSNQLPVYCYLS